MNIRDELLKLQEENYASFCARIIPSINENDIVGVRMPIIRKLAKRIANDNQISCFLNDLPHKYYEENILHAILLNDIDDYKKCIDYVNNFLPYIDNWAVCDALKPKCFKTNKAELLKQIEQWTTNNQEYTIRFAIGALMNNYLDDAYDKKYIEIVGNIKDERYYVQMMQGWYLASAMINHWEDTVEILGKNSVSVSVCNITIQKAIESYRIEQWKREFLKNYKQHINKTYV